MPDRKRGMVKHYLKLVKKLFDDFSYLRDEKKCKGYFVHETAIIDSGVIIGKGTKIWHFTHVLGGSVIGENCTVGQNCMIGPDVHIGNRCKIQNNVSVYKGVTIEDDVFCGPSCVFTNDYIPRAFISKQRGFRETLVKRGASIGANATIVCGVVIGKYAMVGAGAVVTSDVKDYALVVGVPAVQIGWVCKCGAKLLSENDSNFYHCPLCNNIYKTDGEDIFPIREE